VLRRRARPLVLQRVLPIHESAASPECARHSSGDVSITALLQSLEEANIDRRRLSAELETSSALAQGAVEESWRLRRALHDAEALLAKGSEEAARLRDSILASTEVPTLFPVLAATSRASTTTQPSHTPTKRIWGESSDADRHQLTEASEYSHSHTWCAAVLLGMLVIFVAAVAWVLLGVAHVLHSGSRIGSTCSLLGVWAIGGGAALLCFAMLGMRTWVTYPQLRPCGLCGRVNNAAKTVATEDAAG